MGTRLPCNAQTLTSVCTADPGVDRPLYKHRLLNRVFPVHIQNHNGPSTHVPILFPSLVSTAQFTLWHTVHFLMPTSRPLLTGTKVHCMPST